MAEQIKGKENTSLNNAVSKHKFLESLKSKGVIDSLKSQMRTTLLNQMASQGMTIKDDKKQQSSLMYRTICGLISDFMKAVGFSFALSVFVPECGLAGNFPTKQEI